MDAHLLSNHKYTIVLNGKGDHTLVSEVPPFRKPKLGFGFPRMASVFLPSLETSLKRVPILKKNHTQVALHPTLLPHRRAAGLLVLPAAHPGDLRQLAKRDTQVPRNIWRGGRSESPNSVPRWLVRGLILEFLWLSSRLVAKDLECPEALGTPKIMGS